MTQKKLKVSVTALADFSCRVGDLELSGAIGPTARQGMKAHQRIQAQRTTDAEVRLSVDVSIQGVLVTLSGRVDLLDTISHRISEIKTTLVPAERLSDSKLALQWAQITLYGYCYCRSLQEKELELPQEGIELELIHANIRAETQSSSTRNIDADELEAFTLDALARYVEWHKILWQWQDKTRESASALRFPYPEYRHGQRDMAAAIFRTVRDGDSLLCEAPTGTGKTLSSLFPVVKAIGEGRVKHAVYLTAKTSGRETAMGAVRTLEKAGLQITSVMLRSKAPTCFCSNGRCERDEQNTCPMTIGFFDRLPAAREEAIAKGVIDGECLDEIAWQHQICPFEFALQLLPWVSLSVADFNYVFDPLVRIARFSESRRDTALLVDEAHNLVDRARGMHSGHLNRFELVQAHKLIANSHPLLSKKIKALSSALLRTAQTDLDSASVNKSSRNECINVDNEVPKKLVQKASEVVSTYTDAADQSPPLPESLFEIFKMTCRFIAIAEIYSDQHRTVTLVEQFRKQTQVVVNLKCLDAANYLQPQYKLFKGTVVFSATLRPAPFYRDALGLHESTQQLVLGSPFSADQVKHNVVSYINTRYQFRKTSTTDLVALLAALVASKPGNYMVFFPSYAYLEQVFIEFSNTQPHIQTWRQSRDADVEERAKLLKALEEPRTRLGFAILGGVFGEGVDYVGDLLIGVVLVGVGLPGIGVEQDLIAECYREQGLDGYDYAYRYPGFTKVLQTAGRVIRNETDKGVVLLVDDRFNQPFYKKLYPAHWFVETSHSLEQIEQSLKLFWDKNS